MPMTARKRLRDCYICPSSRTAADSPIMPELFQADQADALRVFLETAQRLQLISLEAMQALFIYIFLEYTLYTLKILKIIQKFNIYLLTMLMYGCTLKMQIGTSSQASRGPIPN